MPAASLFDLRGQIRDQKPNAPPSVADYLINASIRRSLNKWRWSDLLRIGAIRIPDAYSTGTIDLTQGSPDVTGVATDWPVNDLVNTTLTADTNDLGNVWCSYAVNATTKNIKQGMLLVIEMAMLV